MKLEELSEVWGISVMHLKDYAKKYKFRISMIYLADLICSTLMILYLYNTNSIPEGYLFGLITVGVSITLISSIVVSQEKWEAFKFYRKFKNCTVEKMRYNLDEKKLCSVLYCAGNKRVKQDRDVDYYKELIISFCCENTSYARKIMKYISKYKSEDEGDVYLYVITKGKNQYFVGFYENNSLSNGEENEDESECDNSGDVE